MSSDFQITLSGKISKKKGNHAKSIFQTLKEMNFSVIDYFDVVRYDPSDNTFEVVDDVLEKDIMGPAARLNLVLTSGSKVNFIVGLISPWMEITVLMGQAGETINCFITISKSKLVSLFREETLGNLYVLYCRVAEAMKATGGIAGMDRDPTLLSPDTVLDSIMHDPQNPDFPVSLGIISADVACNKNASIEFKKYFNVLEYGSYLILEEKDFMDVYEAVSL